MAFPLSTVLAPVVLIATSLVLMNGCSTSREQSAPSILPSVPTESTVKAELALKNGQWTVTFRFSEEREAWLFDTSHGDYRTKHWRQAKGARIEQHGGIDVLVLEPPATEASFVLDLPAKIPDGPLPFLRFSDASTAVFSGQFALLTVENLEAAIELDGNLGRWRGQQPAVEVEVSSDAPMLIDHGVVREPTVVVARYGSGPYIYSGNLSVNNGVLLDPALPTWLQESFVDDFERVQSALNRRWGSAAPQPTIMFSWDPGGGKVLNRGRAEGSQILMTVRGDAYLQPSTDDVLTDLLWFFAHELTHHHQFVDGKNGPSWLIEGLADTVATAVLVDLKMTNRAALERRYWSVAEECENQMRRGPIDGARGRVAHVCGDLAGLMSASLLSDKDLGAAWQQAFERGEVTTESWLETLDARGASREGVEALRGFLQETNTQEPMTAIEAAMRKSGLEPIVVNGGLSSFVYPFSQE